MISLILSYWTIWNLNSSGLENLVWKTQDIFVSLDRSSYSDTVPQYIPLFEILSIAANICNFWQLLATAAATSAAAVARAALLVKQQSRSSKSSSIRISNSNSTPLKEQQQQQQLLYLNLNHFTQYMYLPIVWMIVPPGTTWTLV